MASYHEVFQDRSVNITLIVVFFRKKKGIQKLFLVWVVFNLYTTEYQGACSHQSKRCCILKVDESMWEIVGASNLIGNTTLEQVRKRMAMEDVPDVCVSVLFYLQSWFIVVEVCDFFAPTTFCREVCACVRESFWLDTTYMYEVCCESGVCVWIEIRP